MIKKWKLPGSVATRVTPLGFFLLICLVWFHSSTLWAQDRLFQPSISSLATSANASATNHFVRGTLNMNPYRLGKHTAVGCMQDQSGGIGLYTTNGDSFLTEFKTGDVVEIGGRVVDDHGMKYLVFDEIKKISSGPGPNPRDVSVRDLLNERALGILVRVTGKLFSTTNQGVVVADRSGAIKLYLAPNLLENVRFLGTLKEGAELAITGLASRNATTQDDSGFQLVPRAAADFHFIPPPPFKQIIACLAALLLTLAIATVMQGRRAADKRVKEIVEILAQKERAEDEKRKTERDLEGLISSIEGIVWEADAQSFNFTFVSKQAERLLGYPLKSWLAPGFWKDHIHPEDREGAMNYCLKASREGHNHHFEYRMLAANKQIVWLKDFITVLVENGAVTRLRGIMVDITERKRLGEHLLQAQKMDCIGRLAGGIAHDLNNILMVISGNISLVGLDKTLSAESRKRMDAANEAAERATDLTRSLLMFSRKQAVRLRKINLNETVTRANKLLERVLGEDIVLEFHADTSLGLIEADTTMMEQVLLNLAVNSRDAMPQGGRLIIRTSSELLTRKDLIDDAEARPGRWICLAVEDSGAGISPEIIPHIFDPFFTTKEVGKGTGLGLATVYGIVKQHHGRIHVATEMGRGTTFRIYFPALSLGAAVNLEDKQPILPRRFSGTETILLVEDEPSLRDYIAQILRRDGYQIIEAASGPDALKIWSSEKDAIHLLLSDMVMPGGLTGKGLAEKLTVEKPRLKVILMTGYSAEMLLQDQNCAFAFQSIQKPFSKDAINELVRRALDGKPSQPEGRGLSSRAEG